jgi:TRAP-type C4-dicarboxylate transport system substrate-binding protein
MKNFKYLSLILVIAILVSSLALSCSSNSSSTTSQTTAPASTTTTQAETKPIELIMNFAEPEGHPRWGTLIKPWLDQVEAKTNGKVKFINYFGSSLTTEGNVWEACRGGLSDLAEMYTDANPGKFPLTELLLLPNTGRIESVKNSEAIWRMYKEIPEVQKEWAGVKVLTIFSGPQQKLVSTKKVTTMAEAAGVMTLVWSAAQAESAKKIGLTPVDVAFADMFMSMEKGVLDAVLASYQMSCGTQIATMAKYCTVYPFGASTFYIIMNQEKYDSLPADVKKVFDEMSGDPFVKLMAEGTDTIENSKKATFLELGKGEIVELSSAEYAKWKAALDPIPQQYVDDLVKKGLPAQKVFDFFKAALPQ